MQPETNGTKKNTRSEQSRINGSKSRGAKTPEGKERSKTAPATHRLYTQPPPPAGPEFEALRAQYQTVWNSENQYLADKVDDLVAYRWELNHLRELRRQYLANNPEEVKNEITALDRLDLRIRRCGLEISRIERDAIRTTRFLSANGGSQKLWETKEQAFSETQPDAAIAWAEKTFDINLDDHQAALLSTRHPVIALNAARYSGKTTALALRALHESILNPDRTIACLSPAGALFNKVSELAAIGGYDIANITTKISSSVSLVLIDDAAGLTASPSLNEHVKVILAATPNGTSGYFYNLYNHSDTIRIDAPAEACRTIPESLRKLAKSKLSAKQYDQEFRCKFLVYPQPRCRLLPLTQ